VFIQLQESSITYSQALGGTRFGVLGSTGYAISDSLVNDTNSILVAVSSRSLIFYLVA
jgi:hypothetical protein